MSNGFHHSLPHYTYSGQSQLVLGFFHCDHVASSALGRNFHISQLRYCQVISYLQRRLHNSNVELAVVYPRSEAVGTTEVFIPRSQFAFLLLGTGFPVGATIHSVTRDCTS